MADIEVNYAKAKRDTTFVSVILMNGYPPEPTEPDSQMHMKLKLARNDINYGVQVTSAAVGLNLEPIEFPPVGS